MVERQVPSKPGEVGRLGLEQMQLSRGKAAMGQQREQSGAGSAVNDQPGRERHLLERIDAMEKNLRQYHRVGERRQVQVDVRVARPAQARFYLPADEPAHPGIEASTGKGAHPREARPPETKAIGPAAAGGCEGRRDPPALPETMGQGTHRASVARNRRASATGGEWSTAQARAWGAMRSVRTAALCSPALAVLTIS